MQSQYIDYLVGHVLKCVYVLPKNVKKDIASIMDGYVKNNITESQALARFIPYLESLTPIVRDNNSCHKVQYITESVGITPTNILDIGAGTGVILNELKKHYGLTKEKVFALDLQPIEREDITVIGYTDDMKIPFEDGSIDLIVMLSLLHHVPEREALLKEVSRVLSPTGRVIIREHDDNKSRLYYIFIQLMHYVWYIHNDESRDPLVMMSRRETLNLFKSVGMVSCKYITIQGQNLQRLYGEVYKKLNA